MSDLVLNGINGDSGTYLLPEVTIEQISRVAQGKSPEPDAEEFAKELEARRDQGGKKFRVSGDVTNLAEVGWGVIFAHGVEPEIKEALTPLLSHRQQLAGARFKEFSAGKGYRPNDSKNKWLERAGMGPGPVNPDKVPYYLLIVGDPTQIPYRFQYQLDVQYAVGRIHFDTPGEYRRYAESVVAAESGTARRPRQTAFFGVANPDDEATRLSANNLITPLVEELPTLLTANTAPGNSETWALQSLIGEGKASKAQLLKLLGGGETPALLFSASHGMGFDAGSTRQRTDQGALLCQDWPGPLRHKGAIPPEFYLAADDIGDDADVAGLIAFCFACYGAGTPLVDEFLFENGKRKQIAAQPFLARLPQRLLSHPAGGALALVGHVERAWGYSFMWGRTDPQLQVFQNALKHLFLGEPVGAAMDWFNERYAELSSELSQEIEQIEWDGKVPDDQLMARLWTANNDARNYVVIGDPAVRLAVAPLPEPQTAQPVTLQTPRTPAAGGNGASSAPVHFAVETQKEPASAVDVPFEPATASASQTAAAAEQLPTTEESTESEAIVVTPQAELLPAVQTLAAAPLAEAAPLHSPGRTTLAASLAPPQQASRHVEQAQERLATALVGLADRIGVLVQQVAEGATSLDVTTYSGDPSAAIDFNPRTGKLSGARLRAFTRSGLDGRTIVCVPEKDGALDTALWELHQQQVAQAEARREELLQRVLTVAAETLDALKRLA